ncbi:hypothetical protein RO3G_12621 [Rhizopus delemar RA 99-880]|uniref:ASTRA-associated protein 1 n=1 Tax=Rhizopus delemar (strain RA 99-880 / ATCC MYA-4621 / FGSC 9543 / NRRL 43880) TaxID=246409 RepID=I1CHI0_RHIO9|nr:hypothetical protein RO3G_12621 [Rhizopus delemar RA 99-880]|eukprot:EIE87910.1 hypothetical protein RO3G_12621 [Rhizopus delemar RA 99-880]
MNQPTPAPPPPPTYILREHKSTVNYVCLFDSDNYLASCDEEGWVVIWKLKTRRVVIKWKAHEDNCLTVKVINRDTLISQGRDSMIHIWKMNLDETRVDKMKSIVYNDIGFCKISCLFENGLELLCLGSMEDVEYFGVFDVTRYEWIIRKGGEKRFGACMVVKLYGTVESLFILAGYEDGSTVLWDGNENRMIWHRKEHKEPDTTQSYFISSSADNQICQQSLSTGDIIKKITIKKSGIPTLSIRHDNKIMGSGGYDGRIRLFSINTFKPLAILNFHRDTVYCIDFGIKNNWLIGASKDNRISLWNLF